MPSSPTSRLILTIAPHRGGKATMVVSLHDSCGAPMGPPREISVDLDRRLAALVAALQAFAGQQLALIESPAERRTPDGEPMIAVDAADGK